MKKHPWERCRPLSSWLPGGFSKERIGKVSRKKVPDLNENECVHCGLCWIYCPEGAIIRGDPFTIQYEFCRGCGICAVECKRNAIRMVEEV